MPQPLQIVFHGANAANFRAGFEALIDPMHTLGDVSDSLDGPSERERFENADVLVGVSLKPSMPRPRAVRLYQAPAAGTDAIDMSCLPAHAALCNCFGHESAIAEYVFAALLQRHVPLARADQDLRRQQWTYWAGQPHALRTELSQQTMGLVGFGHIAKTLADRAKAFGMRVLVANRSAVSHPRVDQAYSLAQLPQMASEVDALVVTLPLTKETAALVNAATFESMRPDALIVNVGRGPVVDEQALYEALASQRIGGAVIDTWYQYPAPTRAIGAPSRLDFAGLPNVLMTPHMSGWTEGTVRRRQQTMADNIARLSKGQDLINVVRAASA